MNQFETEYVGIIQDILQNGQIREGRNGITKSLFGKTLTIDMSDDNRFPLLMGRKMYTKGIFGEFAALIRGPKHLDDFRKFDCNYWDQWAEPNGYINIDYGNLWTNFGGVNQLAELKDKLVNNPADRRMIVTGWNPVGMEQLSLPCCHLLYQWYVRHNQDMFGNLGEDQYLDMIWYQRSCDTMIGLPSDIVLAALWNILLANEVGYKPGKITMVFGDIHIYEEHFEKAEEYTSRVLFGKDLEYPVFNLITREGLPLEEFVPSDIIINNYDPYPPITFELKS